MSLDSFLIPNTPASSSNTQASTVLEQSHTEQCKYITHYHIVALALAFNDHVYMYVFLLYETRNIDIKNAEFTVVSTI